MPPMRLKLMPDYECSPLWWDGEPDGDSFRVGDIDPADLNLPPDLRRDLFAWADRFDATLDQDYPPDSKFASEQELESFIEDGRVLTERVRAALGPDCEIRYVPPKA